MSRGLHVLRYPETRDGGRMKASCLILSAAATFVGYVADET
jgi:hypothetical protein